MDTAHQIRANHDIPFIFLTSNTDGRTFARAKLAHPHAFLSKPFRATDLQRGKWASRMGKFAKGKLAAGKDAAS